MSGQGRGGVARFAVAILCSLLLGGGAVPVAAKDKGETPPGQQQKAEAPGQERKAETQPETTESGPTVSAQAEPSEPPETQSRQASKVDSGRASERAAENSAVRRRAAAAEPEPAPQPAPPASAGGATNPPAASPPGRRGRSGRALRRERGKVRRGGSTAPAVISAPVDRPASPVTAPPARDERPARRPRSDAPAPASLPSTEKREAPSVVTRTVTEIVDVIPQPLRDLLLALAVVAALLAAAFAGASARAQRAERGRRELAGDVGLLQSALLPVLPARVAAAAVTAAYRPASGPAAGGDFYDVFALDDHRTCVLVGDVAGHGREALPLTAAVRYTVRAYLESGMPPRRALALAGDVLEGQLRGQLVTVVAAVYDARTSELTYACAGHPAPLLAGQDTGREVCGSPPLGAGAPTGRRGTTLGLAPGALACFHTDGVFDVRVQGGRLGADRLQERVAALTPEDTAEDLLAAITRGSLSQPDDMAAVTVRAPEDSPAPSPLRREEFEVDLADLAGPRARRFLEVHGVTGEAMHEALVDAAGAVAYTETATIVVTTGDGPPEARVESSGPIPLRHRTSA